MAVTHQLTWFNRGVVFVAALILFQSFWPGYGPFCCIETIALWHFLAGCIWLLLAIRALPRAIGAPAVVPRSSFLFAPIITVVLGAILWFHMPQRLSLLIHRPGFERAAKEAPAEADREHGFRRRIGIYFVREIGTDSLGGTYLATGYGNCSLGPDRTSFGFVLKPNFAGSPFGAAGYRTWHLFGD